LYNVKIPISIIFVPRELRQIDVQQLNGKITSKYIIIRLVLFVCGQIYIENKAFI
jgi:hypothetical protein